MQRHYILIGLLTSWLANAELDTYLDLEMLRPDYQALRLTKPQLMK
jgi:hypothetical protein